MEQQLISLYEVGGLGVEDLADQFGLDVGIVRLALAGGSALYRARAETGREIDVTRDEAREMMTVIKGIARGYHDAKVPDRLKAAIYANNEFHGRNDQVKNGANNSINVNILSLNSQLQQLRAARAAQLGLATLPA